MKKSILFSEKIGAEEKLEEFKEILAKSLPFESMEEFKKGQDYSETHVTCTFNFSRGVSTITVMINKSWVSFISIRYHCYSIEGFYLLHSKKALYLFIKMMKIHAILSSDEQNKLKG